MPARICRRTARVVADIDRANVPCALPHEVRHEVPADEAACSAHDDQRVLVILHIGSPQLVWGRWFRTSLPVATRQAVKTTGTRCSPTQSPRRCWCPRRVGQDLDVLAAARQRPARPPRRTPAPGQGASRRKSVRPTTVRTTAPTSAPSATWSQSKRRWLTHAVVRSDRTADAPIHAALSTKRSRLVRPNT